MQDADHYPTTGGSRALLVGHFSTVGDVEVLRQIERRMDAMHLPYDVAPFAERRLSVDKTWLDSRTLDPSRYTHLIVICGPFTAEMAARHDSIFGRFTPLHPHWSEPDDGAAGRGLQSVRGAA